MTHWDIDRTSGGRVTVRDLLVDAERRLSGVGIESASVDAAEIIALVMGTTRSRLIMQDVVDADRRVRIEQLLTKRQSRIPLQHLTGSAPFRRIEVQVGPGVFIPRPETELVTEAAIRELTTSHDRIAVDLCTGSGAIALSLALEVPGSTVYAVEVDDAAVNWTRQNVDGQIKALAAAGSSVRVVHEDATRVADPGHALVSLTGTVDVVVSNPPYIPNRMLPRDPEVRDHDPKRALYGGEDGLDIARGVLRTAAILLRPGGLLVVEHADSQGPEAGERGLPGLAGAMCADDELAMIVNLPSGSALWNRITDRIDFNGRPRFTLARRA